MGIERNPGQVGIQQMIESRHPIYNKLKHLDFWMLCAAALTFPFSVAISNIALVVMLILCLVNKKWLSGAKKIWRNYRTLSLAWMAYFAFYPLGLIWSVDRIEGIDIITHQWYWLCVPAMAIMLEKQRRKEMFLIFLSVGLSLHLLFCLAQIFHWVDFTADGSSAEDPTGHIGHIGFGFVYGIWAGWLLHQGMLYHAWKRWGAWLLAAWAIVMVLLAAGRSGYIIIAVLSCLVIWKTLRLQPWIKTGVILLAAMVIISILVMGPGKARIIWTWNSIQAMQHGDFAHAEARWSLWYSAVLAWQAHIPMGVGTGGYPVTAAHIKHLYPDLKYGSDNMPGHPHSMYLLAFSRWGPFGLVGLMLLLSIWVRTGWREDWQQTNTSSLLTLPAIAMVIYSVSGPGLEEHFSGILTALFLGAGLAAIPAPDVGQSKTSISDV